MSGDILINTTPVGMKDYSDESLVSEEVVKNFSVIVDVNYNPYRTKLLRYGIYHNKQVISGLYMLVAQALKSEEYFQGQQINHNYIEKIVRVLEKNRNIALIGMMGSGKSSVGRELANKLAMNFIDVDEYIKTVSNSTIEELFEVSEGHFRTIEHNVIKELASCENTVIACGGGVVKNLKNFDYLYQNSKVVLINRDLATIFKTISKENRPLLNNYKDFKKLYEVRKNLYYKYAQYIVDNNSEIEKCVENIIAEVVL